MEEKELAQEVGEEGADEATETSSDYDSGGSSLDDDFAAVFGNAQEDDSEEDISGDAEEAGGEKESETGEAAESEAESEVAAAQEAAFKQTESLETDEKPELETVQDDGLTPPARLSAQEKKIFSNIKSKTLRKSIQKMFRDHESGQVKALNEEKQKLNQVLQQEATRLHRQYSEAAQQVQGVKSAIEPYLDKLTFNGKIPVSQGIGELAATHAKLSSSDPKVAVPELKRIAGYLSKRFNTPPEQLFGMASEEGAQKGSEFQTLQKRLEDVTSELNRIKAQPQIDKIRAEVDAVRQEKDGAGRLLYPELHDTNFLVRVNPLVEQIMRANPGMNYGDAHRQAVLISRGKPLNQQPQSLPAATTQTNKPNGVSSGSVRGKSVASQGRVDIVKDAPATGSIHDDWEYIRRSL